MSNELEVLQSNNYEAIAQLTGAYVQSNVVLPQLKVNANPLDNDGNMLPMGYFTITQNDNSMYAAKATFRPFINAYQCVSYDPSEKKYDNRSLIIKSFAEEALDMKGGLACGKIPFKQLAGLTDAELARQKNIKWRRLLYGLVSMKNVRTSFMDKEAVKGEAVDDIVDLPVIWRTSGGSFLTADPALKAITKMKHQFFEHTLELTTKREKNGATTYYNVVIEPNFKDMLKLSKEDMDTFSVFQEVIQKENTYIAKCWREAKQDAVKSQAPKGSYLSDLDLNDDVSDL